METLEEAWAEWNQKWADCETLALYYSYIQSQDFNDIGGLKMRLLEMWGE